jgi:photosystem II stability/assembly factor-like uncharacterized protein
MRKRRVNFIIVLSLFLMFFMTSNAYAMQLLTPKIGWILTEKGLYWTTDAGSTWRNITPPSESFGNITAAFFLNTSQGWVLCCNNKGEYKEFNIAYSNDSGKTWSSQPIKLPNKDQINQISKKLANPDRGYNQWNGTLKGTGWIDFIDPLHGWVILEIPAIARLGFTSGLFLQTTDGGKTWKSIGGCLPVAGEFYFITSTDGWLSGYIDNHLYVTHDGGNSWKQVMLQPPPQASANCWYSLPIFKDSQDGFLPVTYVSNVLILFITNDGGNTWKLNRVLPEIPDTDSAFPLTMIDSILITLTSSDSEQSLTLIKVLPDGKIIKTTANALHIKGNITLHSLYFSSGWYLTFITSKQGWVTTNSNQLLSTTDGGETWTVITPQ